jgi:selenocysteine lyase/cysteine desulfurase
VDASQSAGVFPINVQKDNIDILCFTGHKGLLGPTGTGGIFVNPEINITPLIVGGSGSHSFDKLHPQEMPDKLEAGTLNIHGISGLNASLKYILKIGIDSIREKELKLARLFYDKVSKLPKVEIYGEFKSFYRAPIVTLNIQGITSSELTEILSENFNIAVRGGIHCAPLMHKALNTSETGAVRFSFSHLNTEEEVLYGINAIKEIISFL